MAEGLQRRSLKCEKLTDDRRRTPSDGKSSHCLWQGELIILKKYPKFLCTMSKQGQITLDIQITGSSALL